MAEIVISVDAVSRSKTRAEVSARDLVFNVDEPERLGGSNTGPNPTELVLGALAGCFNVLGHMVAKEMGFEITSLKMHLAGTLDPLSYLGKKPTVRPGYKEIVVGMDVETSATPEQLEEWARAVEARCPVSDNIEHDTPVKIDISTAGERPKAISEH